MGEVLALKAWYCDSTHRYTNTDAVQPLPVTSKLARKPGGTPKADLRQYFMLAHGSPLVDPARVGVVGASQGGGIALAMAGLVPDLAVAVIQAPFLCELDRAATLSREHPYSLLTQYLADRRGDAATALDTLRYFDGVNHAQRATAPALLSTGMLDGIAPPETVLPAFSAYAGAKTVVLWPYNGHEAGGDLDEENALDFAAQHLAVDAPRPAPAGSLR